MGAMEELTAALKENTAMLKALSGNTAAATTKPTTTKAAAAKAEEEEKPKRSPGRPAKAKSLSSTEMGEKAREFAEGADDDEDEFKARRAFLVKVSKKFDAPKFSEIKGDDQKEALAMLEEYLADDGGDGDGDGDY